MAKKFEIRNSTAEFLIFQIEGKEDGVQVVYRDETIWCTQKAMAQLFDCSTDNHGGWSSDSRTHRKHPPP